MREEWSGASPKSSVGVQGSREYGSGKKSSSGEIAGLSGGNGNSPNRDSYSTVSLFTS